MKKKILEAVLLSCIITLMVACNPKKEEPVAAPVIDKEQIKKEIQAKENEYAELYNTGELRNIGYYAEDATVFSQNKQKIPLFQLPNSLTPACCFGTGGGHQP